MQPKQQTGTDVASNAIATTKKPGGITGRGFLPGQSGNPEGGTRRRKEAKAVGELIRDYLAQPDEEATKAAGRKVTRLQSLIMRLAESDPRTLLAYAYGKPVEMIQQLPQWDQVINVEIVHAHELKAQQANSVNLRFADEDDAGG